MSVYRMDLFPVMRRFRKHKSLIQKLYGENEDFKSVCDDYLACLDAVDHWRRSSLDEAQARIDEYSELLRDLESEILRKLNDA